MLLARLFRSRTSLCRCSAAMLLILALAAPAQEASRIKDLVDFEGIRDNPLVGYGLVVGLDGTGDSLNKAPFTRQILQGMLERLGVNTREERSSTPRTWPR